MLLSKLEAWITVGSSKVHSQSTVSSTRHSWKRNMRAYIIHSALYFPSRQNLSNTSVLHSPRSHAVSVRWLRTSGPPISAWAQTNIESMAFRSSIIHMPQTLLHISSTRSILTEGLRGEILRLRNTTLCIHPQNLITSKNRRPTLPPRDHKSQHSPQKGE